MRKRLAGARAEGRAFRGPFARRRRRGLLEEIDAESLALVGHEPNLSLLAAFLLTGDHGLARLEMKEGGAALLELPDRVDDNGGKAILRWSVSPKILRRLDGERD